MNQSNFCNYDVSSVHGFTGHLKLSLLNQIVGPGWLVAKLILSQEIRKLLFASRIYHVIEVCKA
jgi:hypothetical protein